MTNPRRLQLLREDYAAAFAPFRALMEADSMTEAEKQRWRVLIDDAYTQSLSAAEEELLAQMLG